MNCFFNKLRDNCFGIWWVKEICIGSIFFWHKQRYHTHTDVIFGWVASIWLNISTFLLRILTFFSWCVENWKITQALTAGPSGLRSGLLSALRASLRPPLRSSGPAVSPRRFFNFTTHHEKTSRYLQKSRESAKFTLSAKKTSVFIYYQYLGHIHSLII